MNGKSYQKKTLDSQKSFIVQAPAGSGKTELLIQRFLQLLATVKIPEEIVAITFTRKAGAEMRERIIAALNAAQTQSPPPPTTEPHKNLTWKLAKAVIERNQKYDWQLDINPNRLRLLTIDALANQICSKMPILSGFGAPPIILESEEIFDFYRKAVTKLFKSRKHADSIEKLLFHLDNKTELLEKLLVQMLIHREQWLRYVMNHYRHPNIIKKLEKALITVALDAIQTARALITPSIANELICLSQFAGLNIYKKDPTSVISMCSKLDELPEVSINDVILWKGIAELFLTKEGSWRKKLTKNEGFPVKNKEYKQRMKNLLSQLNHHETLRLALNEVKNCPPLTYSKKQWNIIQSLMIILPMLVIQLNIIFQENNTVDFTEITLGAIRALKDSNKQSSNYSLELNEQIHHLLIDEFQDTSLIQFQLIENLIANWKPNDGRTLFLVGDPMQSIYRFRQAQVGLFLQVKSEGIGEIQLTSLTLKNNFRSQKNLVAWFNKTFKCIFPKEENHNLGSIPYFPSFATSNNTNKKNVNFYSLLNASALDEAKQILRIIQSCFHKKPETTIAILIRSRLQLKEIIPVLRDAKIPFHGVEIEKLKHRTEIRDLISLTSALHHFGDRIAWLSLLRAPWCGVTLHDLYALSRYADNNKPIWVSLQNTDKISMLSSDGKKRIDRIFLILSASFDNRDRLPLAQWIEGIWTALGGPTCLSNSTELINVHTYLRLLEKLENEFTLDRLNQKLNQLYAQVQFDNDSKNSVQIMTIHKAKGLEFDHVILPSLEKRPRHDENDLLLCLEYHVKTGYSEMILSPLKAISEKVDPVYNYLKRIEKEREANEIKRLLYVAATRAKESLHLLALINKDNKENAKSPITLPPKGSFLEILWISCQEMFKKSIIVSDSSSYSQTKNPKLFRRLTSDWTPPFILKTLSPPIKFKPIVTSLTKGHSKIIGIVIHEILEKISNEDLKGWNKIRIKNNQSFWKRRLIQLGAPPYHLKKYLSSITRAITKTLSDNKGRWLLSHRQSQISEYPITVIYNNQIKYYIVDRTFIDEQGVRWIVDYKSSMPVAKEPFDLFLKRQCLLHKAQLHRYAKAFTELDPRRTKLGLYFPLCQGWCEL